MKKSLGLRVSMASVLLTVCVLATQSSADLLKKTPYLHYTFDNPFNLGQDTSGNNRHANLVAPAAQSTTDRKFGMGAINLTGGGFLNLSAAINSADFTTTGAASLTAWVKLNTAAAQNGFDSLGNPATANSHYTWSDGFGYYRTFRNTRVDVVVYPWDTDANPNNNGDEVNWHHLAITNDPLGGATGWKLYIDGELLRTAPFESFSSMGSEWLGRNDLGNTFEGLFDEVWLFNQTLTQAEVRELFLNNATPEPSSILVWGAIGVGACVFGWRRFRRAKQ